MQDLQSHHGIVRDGKEFFTLMERCSVDKQKGKMREEGIERQGMTGEAKRDRE